MSTRDYALKHAETAHEVGLGVVWDQIASEPESAAIDMLLGIVSALAQYMHESGTYLSSTAASRADLKAVPQTPTRAHPPRASA